MTTVPRSESMLQILRNSVSVISSSLLSIHFSTNILEIWTEIKRSGPVCRESSTFNLDQSDQTRRDRIVFIFLIWVARAVFSFPDTFDNITNRLHWVVKFSDGNWFWIVAIENSKWPNDLLVKCSGIAKVQCLKKNYLQLETFFVYQYLGFTFCISGKPMVPPLSSSNILNTTSANFSPVELAGKKLLKCNWLTPPVGKFWRKQKY